MLLYFIWHYILVSLVSLYKEVKSSLSAKSVEGIVNILQDMKVMDENWSSFYVIESVMLSSGSV